MIEEPPASIPLQFAPPERFATVREFLAQTGYTAEAILNRLNFNGLHEILTGRRPAEGRPAADCLDLLIQLFLLGDRVEEAVLEAHLPAPVRTAMEELGLLAGDQQTGGRYAPVLLYPVKELYIASDRFSNPDGSPFTAPDDVVYPAITKNTRAFLDLLPATPCERLLDLCSGTAVAALDAVATGAARRAWAADIAERSTGFAEFNRRLNRLTGVEMLTGDVYEPVQGESFDRIVVHPPYVPSLETKWVFRDGGAEGESVTRKVVSGLPDHLQPGGRLYCLALGAEHREESFEQRLRRWLGEKEGEFDLLLVELETYTPEKVAFLPVLAGQRSHREYQKWRDLFARSGIERFVYGLIVLQRQETPRPAFTARRTAGPRSGSPEIEWLLDWQTRSAGADFRLSLLEARPLYSPHLELLVSHRPEGGSLTPAGFRLKTEYPFEMECEIQPWTAQLIARCDGGMTGRELFEFCRREGLIRGSVTAEDFTVLLQSLVAGGFVAVEGVSGTGAAE